MEGIKNEKGWQVIINQIGITTSITLKDDEDTLTLTKLEKPHGKCNYVVVDQDGFDCPYSEQEIMDDFGIDVKSILG